MGQIRKRGRIYWIRYYRNGQRIEESAETKKWEDARDLLREREGAIAKGIPVTARSTKLSFDDAVQDVIADYTVNGKKSVDNLTRRIDKHLMPWFGGKRLSAITVADIRAFIADRQRTDTDSEGVVTKAGASNAEINRELAILRRAFRLASAAETYHGRIPKFPMLQERNARQGFFDDAMIDEVIATLPKAARPVARFAYITGWRTHSEVLPLQWRQVDRQAGEVRLEPGTTKNQAGRVFPFTDALRTLLDGLWVEHEKLAKAGAICPYVFQRNGKPIRTFRASWANACEAAGHPGMLLHDLRRSAVRNMERAGLSRSVAMQLTGHKTEAIYRRYAITSEADLREGVARLNTIAGTIGGDNRRSSNLRPA